MAAYKGKVDWPGVAAYKAKVDWLGVAAYKGWEALAIELHFTDNAFIHENTFVVPPPYK